MLSTKSRTTTLAAAAALIAIAGVAGSTTAIAKGNAAKVHCYGINSCKGTSDCKSGNHECKGQNSCKGQGFKETTAKACKKAGGSTTAPAM